MNQLSGAPMSQKTSINVELPTCAVDAESRNGLGGRLGEVWALAPRCVGCWRLLRSGDSAVSRSRAMIGGASLTAREIDVVRLWSLGYTYARTAERLGLSAHTVASHVKKIYGKLGVHAVGAAVMSAMKLGIIE